MTISIQRVKAVLSEFSRQKILVVGDLMLDRYIYGRVDRISPEAPVPVVHVNQEKSVPGGSTNVAWNVRSLGAASSVCGLIGRDPAGAELRGILDREGVSTAGTRDVGTMRTIVKTRIIAERQQVVRIDWEDPWVLEDNDLNAFCAGVEAEVGGATGVIIEDYGKGVVQQRVVDAVLAAAKKKNVPVGLDPKDNHEMAMTRLTVATPNRKEAFAIAGVRETPAHANPPEDKALMKVCGILREKWDPDMLMITLGPQGMLLATRDGQLRHVPTRAREVFDVSGAGDTVIATCLLAIAAGAGPLEAAELANYAAGVVVGKLGTATCTQEELIRYME